MNKESRAYIPFIYLYTHLQSSEEFYLLKAFEIDFHFVYCVYMLHSNYTVIGKILTSFSFSFGSYISL